MKTSKWKVRLAEVLRDEDGQLTASYLLLLMASIVLGYLIVRFVASVAGGGDLPCPGGGLIDCPDNAAGGSIFDNYIETVKQPSYHNGPY